MLCAPDVRFIIYIILSGVCYWVRWSSAMQEWLNRPREVSLRFAQVSALSPFVGWLVRLRCRACMPDLRSSLCLSSWEACKKGELLLQAVSRCCSDGGMNADALMLVAWSYVFRTNTSLTCGSYDSWWYKHKVETVPQHQHKHAIVLHVTHKLQPYYVLQW
jgi:hypothetical protein